MRIDFCYRARFNCLPFKILIACAKDSEREHGVAKKLFLETSEIVRLVI